MTTWWRTVACGCAVILALTAGPAAWAVFTDPANVTSGTLAAGVITTPSAPTMKQGVGTVTVTWTTTAAGPADGKATAYELLSYPSGGGAASTVCTASPNTSCTLPNPTTGGYSLSVRARVGENWVKESARTAYTPDRTGPVLTSTAPCSPSVACGTATDPGGIASVEYQLTRTRTTVVLSSTQCWNGTAWVSQPCAFAPAAGTTSWTVPGAFATAYVGPPLLTTQSFTLQVRATDAFGNVSAVQTTSYSA